MARQAWRSIDCLQNGPMKPWQQFPPDLARTAHTVLTDIDDTLTTHGRLLPDAYAAMARLQQAGLRVIPVTGRPAGWCDMIARTWPVDGVIGENGAFYMWHDNADQRLRCRHWDSDVNLSALSQRLAAVRERVLAEVPGSRVASDQFARWYDLAIDFCEDVPALPRSAVDRIVAIMQAEGMTARSAPSTSTVGGGIGTNCAWPAACWPSDMVWTGRMRARAFCLWATHPTMPPCLAPCPTAWAWPMWPIFQTVWNTHRLGSPARVRGLALWSLPSISWPCAKPEPALAFDRQQLALARGGCGRRQRRRPLPLAPPSKPPSTPRTISRPMEEPTVRTALLMTNWATPSRWAPRGP